MIYVKTVIHNILLNLLNDLYAPDSQSSKLDARLDFGDSPVFSKDKADAFSNPALDSFLVANGINKLVITGLDLSGCVNYSILSARNRNYRISLINDAVLAKSDSLAVAKLNDFSQRGIEIISGDEFLKQMRQLN